MLPDKYSRLLVYLHLDGNGGAEVNFDLNGIQIENLSTGDWETLSVNKINIASNDLSGKQIKLSEVILTPGSYGKIKLDINDVNLFDTNGKKIPLKLNSESFYFNGGLNLKNKESLVLQLAWNSGESVGRGNVFEPSIDVIAEQPLAQGLAVFVSNSGSNYLSIIDKDLERVVGALTVGSEPMGMALNYGGGKIYVVNRQDSSISIVDIYNQDVLETIGISAYSLKPSDIAYLPKGAFGNEGTLYVLSSLSNDVVVIDTLSSKVVKTIPVGLVPSGMVADSKRAEVYVSNKGSDSVTIISSISDSVSATVDIGCSPKGVALGGEGVYAFCGEAGGIKVLSPAEREVVSEIVTASAPKRGLVAYDERFYVANESSSEVSLFDEFGVFISDITVGMDPVGIAGDRVKDRVYVTNFTDNSVSIIDSINDRTKVSLSVGDNPYGVVVLEK